MLNCMKTNENKQEIEMLKKPTLYTFTKKA